MAADGAVALGPDALELRGGAVGPADDQIGQLVGAVARAELVGDAVDGPDRRATVQIGEACVMPAAISSISARRPRAVDDPVALAAPQVEPDVALVLGRVGERPGRGSSRSRAARAAR